MKKLLLFACSFLLLGSAVYAQNFPDVSDDHAHFTAIEYLFDHGIINGYQDGTFGPDNNVNRAEAAKIMAGAFDVAHDGEYEVLFPDVKIDDWFFSYVMGMQQAEIVKGYNDGTYRPENTVSFAESLKIMVISAGETVPDTVENEVFVDVKPADWFAPYFFYSRNNNIVFPNDYGEVFPNSEMNRGDFAEIIYRMMIVQEGGKAFPLETTWSNYTAVNLPFSMKYDDEKWTVTKNENEIVFLRPDTEFAQFSAERVYPNSAVVTVTYDYNESELTDSQYFSNIKGAFNGGTFSEFSIGGLSALEVLFPADRTVDWYIYRNNGDVITIYTEYGDGVLHYQLQQYIKTMLSTFQPTSLVMNQEDYSEVLSQILAAVLVEKKGMEMLNKVDDKIIIETDAIGVGSGPVDYYFSANLNYTFKYERGLDTILDTREGQTTAF